MDSNILIDWLTFSSKIDDFQSIKEFLGLSSCDFKLASGRYMYGRSYRFGNISIYTDGLSDDMGVCVEMSGQGCRDYESYGNADWDSVFQYFLQNPSQVNISRLDVAYDDFDKLLDLEKVIADTYNGNYTSKLKHWNVQKGSRGATVEHGTRGGDMYIRIYDKKAERNRDDLEYWCRCELQMRHDTACNFVKAMYKPASQVDHGTLYSIFLLDTPIEQLYFEVLNNYLRYVKPPDVGNDSQKYRWETAPHWLEFLQTGARRSIFVAPGVEYNMERLYSYVFSQAGNAIRTYIDIAGIDEFQRELEKVKKSRNVKYDLLRAQAAKERMKKA